VVAKDSVVFRLGEKFGKWAGVAHVFPERLRESAFAHGAARSSTPQDIEPTK
jgi:hypothetical protein